MALWMRRGTLMVRGAARMRCSRIAYTSVRWSSDTNGRCPYSASNSETQKLN